MQVRFFNDRDTGIPHIISHGVEPWEAIDILERHDFDYNGRNGTRIAIGQTRDGRYLRVIYKRNIDHILVITAYDLPPKAKAALRRRRRK
jgi:hypothetical protein